MHGSGFGASSASGIGFRGVELARYVAAGVVYVAIGVAFPDFLLSWVVAAAYLLAVMWLLPALVRRARR